MNDLMSENTIQQQRFWLVMLGCVGVLFLFEQFGLLEPLLLTAAKKLQPFQEFGTTVVRTVQYPYKIITLGMNSYKKIQNIEEQNARLIVQLSELEKLKTENSSLRETLQATASSHLTKREFVSILNYGKPLISRENATYESGDPAFIQGVFVGRVGALGRNQAELSLLSQQFVDPVVAKTATGVTGLLYGDGRQLVLRQLPIEQVIEVGQQVFTAGQNGVQPNWYIGRIREVIRHEGSPTQEATVDQGVSFFHSSMVEVP